MPSNTTIAVGGGSAVHKVRSLQNGVLTKFVFDAQHGLLEPPLAGQLRRLSFLFGLSIGVVGEQVKLFYGGFGGKVVLDRKSVV